MNTSFPVTNLQTYIVSDVSKSNSTGSDQYFQIDLGSAIACDTIVIDGHNFATVDPDTNIKLQYNTNDDTTWTDAEDAVVIMSTLAYTNNTVSKTFSTQTKRYWRILFSSTAAVPIQIGNIFLGTRLAFDSTYEWDFARGNKEYETQESTSLNGLVRMSQVFAGRKRWDLQFRLQSNTFKSSFDTFIDTVRGKLRPFYFVDVDSAIYYVHLDTDYNDVRGYRYNMNNLQIQLKSQTVS